MVVAMTEVGDLGNGVVVDGSLEDGGDDGGDADDDGVIVVVVVVI